MRRPVQSIPALPAEALRVCDGANLDDPIGLADDIEFGDVYRLDREMQMATLSVSAGDDGVFEITGDSELGTSEACIHLDCCLTLMAPDGGTVDCIIAVEVDGDGLIESIFVLPLHPLTPDCDYAIVGVDRTAGASKIAQMGCVSFARGTRITLASGGLQPIEALNPGDLVLTRDAGPQTLRWIGHTTLKAEGAFAPVLIRAGTLNNLGDLLLSPDHGLFIYQREDALGAGRSEVLVRAQHLVNGESVVRQRGGWVDYFQLLFDEHHIIYAEGIAAESLLVDGQTRAALPAHLAARGHDATMRSDYEVDERLARRPDAAELLRRASTR